jgi:uncharacterized protein (DUF58 family)
MSHVLQKQSRIINRVLDLSDSLTENSLIEVSLMVWRLFHYQIQTTLINIILFVDEENEYLSYENNSY